MENNLPCVKYGGGIRSNLDVSIGDGATVTLPSTTTIGGSAVVALGDITSSSTTATAFSVTNSGVFTGTNVVAIVANSLTTGKALSVSTTGATSGTSLYIANTAATLTSGKYIQCYNGAADVFTVSKYGATVIAGNASGTAALTVTAGDIVITSGYLVISANAKGITFTGTGANGGVLKNLKNAAPTALSGTQKDIEIDIGGNPVLLHGVPNESLISTVRIPSKNSH